jgi:hypothetical protein
MSDLPQGEAAKVCEGQDLPVLGGQARKCFGDLRSHRGRSGTGRSRRGRFHRARVATFGTAWQPVVGDRLPGRGIGHELADARPYPRITVKSPYTNADRVRVTGIAAEQRRATVAAEPFLAAVVRPPDSQPVLTHDDPKRSRRGMGVCGRGRAAAALAAPAMAVARADGRRCYLEPDGAAVATAGEWEVVHLSLPALKRAIARASARRSALLMFCMFCMARSSSIGPRARCRRGAATSGGPPGCSVVTG